MPLLIWGGAAALAAFGYAADKTGEGVNDASSGAVKLAVAGAVGLAAYVYAKKKGVI